jgi:hypothetical protein
LDLNEKELPLLRLDKLHERHTGLTPALAESYTEAACTCFSRHHSPPVTVSLMNDDKLGFCVIPFAVPDTRALNAYANEIDATETGAYAVSLAAVEAVAGLVAVRRAETLTGADWYVAPTGDDSDDLENCIRLEVSGTSTGTANDIRRRVREKLSQTARGASNLPAMAAVVGFKALEIVIAPLGVSE